jgi:hypothetical protein
MLCGHARRPLDEVAQGRNYLPHSPGVQPAVFFKLTAHAISFPLFWFSKNHAKLLPTGGVAIPNCEIFVAPACQGRQDGIHGGTAILGGMVILEDSEWF